MPPFLFELRKGGPLTVKFTYRIGYANRRKSTGTSRREDCG